MFNKTRTKCNVILLAFPSSLFNPVVADKNKFSLWKVGARGRLKIPKNQHEVAASLQCCMQNVHPEKSTSAWSTVIYVTSDQPERDYLLKEVDFKLWTREADFSHQTRSLVVIAPAYATAHMSQILMEAEESASSPTRSSKHFRCAPLWFPIAILWEFNLIPADTLYPQAWVCKKKKKWDRLEHILFFLRKPGYLGVGSLSLSLSLFLSASLPHLNRDYFILCAGVLVLLAISWGAFMD